MHVDGAAAVHLRAPVVRLVGVLAAAEAEPALDRLPRGDARGGHGAGAEDARADEVLILDGEA